MIIIPKTTDVTGLSEALFEGLSVAMLYAIFVEYYFRKKVS